MWTTIAVGSGTKGCRVTHVYMWANMVVVVLGRSRLAVVAQPLLQGWETTRLRSEVIVADKVIVLLVRN